MVRYSINVPQDTHERLILLSEHYNKDIKEIINESIHAVSFDRYQIINASKEYQVPLEMRHVVIYLLRAGFRSTRSLFNKFLEILEAKGLFTQDDLDVNFSEMCVAITYGALPKNGLYVDSFYVLWYGVADLSATYYLDIDAVDDTVVAKIKDIAENIEETGDFHENFPFLNLDYSVDVIEEDDFLDVSVRIFGQELDYLPTIPTISEFIKQLMEKAGVKINALKE